MSRDGKHPCDVCERQNKASGCSGCIWDLRFSSTCGNCDCEFYYEGDCTLGVSDECKASDNYHDDMFNHDCSECVRFTEKIDSDGVPYYTCGEDGAQIGQYDDVCEEFEESE